MACLSAVNWVAMNFVALCQETGFGLHVISVGIQFVFYVSVDKVVLVGAISLGSRYVLGHTFKISGTPFMSPACFQTGSV